MAHPPFDGSDSRRSCTTAALPLAKIEGEGGGALTPKGVKSLNVEIHTDRKLGVKDEEERDLVLGGLWASARD